MSGCENGRSRGLVALFGARETNCQSYILSECELGLSTDFRSTQLLELLVGLLIHPQNGQVEYMVLFGSVLAVSGEVSDNEPGPQPLPG